MLDTVSVTLFPSEVIQKLKARLMATAREKFAKNDTTLLL
jgi:hypothetical protein